MLFVILGIIVGVAIGFYLPFSIPAGFSIYISVSILAALDSIFGAIRAGFDQKFNSLIFITGFFSNAILAGILAYIGDKLGIPLYYAAIFVFGIRLFDNLAIIRRTILKKFTKEQ
jgi:small basic protein